MRRMIVRICTVFALMLVPETLSQANCGTRNLIAEVGKLKTHSSPRYPANYPLSLNCWWTITAPKGYRIMLNLVYFTTESCCDKLRIYNSRIRRSYLALSIGELAGTVPPQTIVSPRNYITLNFVTDTSITFRGFNFTYKAERREAITTTVPTTTTTTTTRDASSCGFTVEATSKTTPLNSPNHPRLYSSNADCTWRISAPSGHLVQLTIGKIDTERCCDFIQIFDDNNQIAELAGRLGEEVFTYLSSSKVGLRIRFRSDISVNRQGFEGLYRSISAVPPYPDLPLVDLCGSELRATTLTQELNSPNWPEPYPPSIDCEWLIKAQSGFVIEFTVQITDLEACCDYISILENDTLVQRVSGVSSTSRIFTSNSTLLKIKFHSDRTIVRRGFQATYKQIIPPTAPVPTRTVSAEISRFRLFDDEEDLDRNCGKDLVANDDIVDLNSPGYSNSYPEGAKCLWKILPALGERVQFTIGRIDTERCCDIIEVFNGSTSLARLFGKITRPKTFFSEVNAGLIIQFISDESVNKRGFRGVFRSLSVPPNGEAPPLPLPSDCDYEMTANSTVQNFHTPGWPVQQEPNLECSWVIHAGTDGMEVLLSIAEGNTETCCDFAEIFSGNTSIGRVSGVIDTPHNFSSSGGVLRVHFSSDSTLSLRGFRFTVHEGVPPTQPVTTTITTTPAELCEINLIAEETEQEITSPNYPLAYDQNVNCTWFIRSPVNNTQILLVVEEIITEPCCDYLELFYEANRSVAQLRGTVTNRVFRSSHQQMILLFHSDHSDHRKGFRITFKRVAPLTRDTQINSTTFNETTESGQCGFETNATIAQSVIRSPRWPNLYPNDAACTWIINAPVRGKIQLNFTFLSVESCCDPVHIWEENQDILKLKSSQRSQTFLSNGNRLFVNFSSDSSIRRKGFEAHYSLIPPPTTTTTTTTSTTTTTTTTITTTTISTAPTIPPGSICGYIQVHISDVPVQIMSPNYPANYPSSSNCTWLLVAPDDRNIVIDFQDVQVEKCCDCVAVTDGRDDRLIAILNDEFISSNREFQSSTSLVKIRFLSDFSVNRKGFLATAYLAPGKNDISTDACGFTHVATDSWHYFTSPGYPFEYPANSECHWLLVSPDPFRQVIFRLHDIKIEEDCDVLEIRDGRNGKAPIIARVQHTITQDHTFTSTARALYIKFTSDLTVHFRGFRGSVKLGDRVQSYSNRCYALTIAEANGTNVIREKHVMECEENSHCLTISAASLARHIRTDELFLGEATFGTCVPASACETTTCDILRHSLTQVQIPYVMNVTNCSVSCCPYDLCNDIETVFVPIHPTRPAIPQELTTDAYGCASYDLDLMFLLDSSGSINQEEFDATLYFVKALVSEFDLNRIQVGVMQYSFWYSNRPLTTRDQIYLHTAVNVGEYRTQEGLQASLRGLDVHGFPSFTAHAIEKAVLLDLASSDRFGNSCTRRAIVVVTDGPTSDVDFLRTSIRIASAVDTHMFAVGVRGYDLSQLQTIAGRGQGNDNRVFTVDSFEELSDLLEPLRSSILALI